MGGTLHAPSAHCPPNRYYKCPLYTWMSGMLHTRISGCSAVLLPFTHDDRGAHGSAHFESHHTNCSWLRSTPFNAKNIAELRAKVLAGRYKPITPGRYSEDFISVINGLLQLNPAKRMDMTKLLALPRMVALSHGPAARSAAHNLSSGEDLLKTIKVSLLSYFQRALGISLCPKANIS